MRLSRRYKAVGFDMDGTLLNTNIDYSRLGTVEADVLESAGVPSSLINTHTDDCTMIRDGIRYLTDSGKDITFDDICEMINQRAGKIEMESVETAVCFPGTEDMLRGLKKKGYPIGLLTRGQRRYALEAMERCGILDLMDVIEAFDDHPHGEQKPNPIAMEYLAKRLNVECSDILYIGDSIWDYFCARDSGAGFIGIASDDAGRQKWDRLKDDVPLIKSVAELSDIL